MNQKTTKKGIDAMTPMKAPLKTRSGEYAAKQAALGDIVDALEVLLPIYPFANPTQAKLLKDAHLYLKRAYMQKQGI